MLPDPNLIFGLRQVEFSYIEERLALQSIDLQVCRGESVAILGANGCGKSTLLSIMDGLIFPTKGIFEAYGNRITESKLAHEEFARFFRSRVAFVFQNPDVQLFCPTVLEEVSFGEHDGDVACQWRLTIWSSPAGRAPRGGADGPNGREATT